MNKRLLNKLLATATPAHLAYHCTQGRWKPAPHLLLLQKALLRVASGEIKRLQVSMPPQHGKSELCSHWFPAWMFGVFPDLRVMLASYEAENAEVWGQRVRETLEEYGQLFGVGVDPRQSAKHNWRIRGRRGRMFSFGVGGPGTGKDADLAIIDDPVKDDADAQSATQREKKWQWYLKVMERRLSGGSIILVMTRWHPEDLAGRLYTLEREGKGEQWHRVILPAICPDPGELPPEARDYFGEDPLGRRPGEALWPEKHPEAEYKNWREKDETSFWALGQQFPYSPAGSMFSIEWLQRHWRLDDLPLEFNGRAYQLKPGRRPFEKVAISADFTFGSASGTSWCVLQVWGKMGSQLWLLYQIREKMEFPVMVSRFKGLVALFPMAQEKLIEAKASGPYVIRLLSTEISGIIPIDARDSKPVRAAGVTYLFEAGNVLLPPAEQYPWVRGYQAELVAFPRGATDDQVDASSQMLAYWSRPQTRVHQSVPDFFRS